MSGLLQSIFQNFRKFPKIIPINLLVIGAGGGGAGGAYYNDGRGGNAGYAATVYDTSNVITTNFTYTVTVASSTGGGSQTWNGSSWVVTPGGTGGASYISGTFRSNVGLTAPGGSGTAGFGGGSGGAGLSTPLGGVYSAITGGAYYASGASGGGYQVYIGGTGGGASGSSPGSAGGGGGGAGTAFGYQGLGAPGGGGAAGIVIMRCRQDAYTTATQSGATQTTVTIDSIVYTLFTWNTSGTIIFT